MTNTTDNNQSITFSQNTPFNPEFRRQIWLEFSKFRLIGMPVFLGLILYLSSLGKDDSNIITTANFMYMILVIVWGTFRAVQAMGDEIKNNTWDFQKMSPQSPWSLVIGKLFGATSFTWYGGLMCLAVIAYVNAFGNILPEKQISLPEFLHMAYTYIAAGIIGHAAGILLCLQSITYSFGKGRLSMAGYTILAILFSSSFITGHIFNETEWNATINWYGNNIDSSNFQALSLAYFLVCVLISLYRSMRKELQFRDKPYAWLAFIISIIAYFGGFVKSDVLGIDIDIDFKFGAWYSMAFIISTFCVYGWAYIEARNSVTYRRFFAALHKRDKAQIFETTPLWILTAIFMIVSWIGLLSIVPNDGSAMKFHTFLVAIMLFICRDIAVMHLLFFGKNNQRAPLAFIIYLVVAYPILAGIENGVGGFDKGFGIFAPVPGNNFIMAILPITVQLILVGSLLKKLWLSKNAQTDANE